MSSLTLRIGHLLHGHRFDRDRNVMSIRPSIANDDDENCRPTSDRCDDLAIFGLCEMGPVIEPRAEIDLLSTNESDLSRLRPGDDGWQLLL